MKTLIAFALLLVAVAVAQVPSAPQNLSLSVSAVIDMPIGTTIPVPVTMGTNNPLGLAHQEFAAYWQMPSAPVRQFNGSFSNIWVPEVSTDGLAWSPAGSHFAQMLPRWLRTNDGAWCLECWNFTEIGTNNPTLVRIRRIQ